MRISDWSSDVCSSDLQSSGALSSNFQPRHRYTGSAFTSDLAWLFGAGFAPMVALWLSSEFGLIAAGAYLLSGAIGTLVALWLNRELRSEEHTSELQSLMRISDAVFCLKKKKQKIRKKSTIAQQSRKETHTHKNAIYREFTLDVITTRIKPIAVYGATAVGDTPYTSQPNDTKEKHIQPHTTLYTE